MCSLRVCAHTGAENKSRMRTQCCRSRSRCMHTNSNTTHSRGVYDDTSVAKHQQLQAREGQRPPPRHLFCTNFEKSFQLSEIPSVQTAPKRDPNTVEIPDRTKQSYRPRPNRCEIFCPCVVLAAPSIIIIGSVEVVLSTENIFSAQ